MSRWAKMDAGLDANPKICAAGRAGREVFLFLLRRNALLEADGEIPAVNASPEYLARQLDMPVTEARDAVVTLVTVGLLVTDDGVVRFAGWSEEWQGPKSDAVRAAAYRARKQPKTSEQSERVTANHDASRPVTSSHRFRGEEKRGEERREDIAPPPAPPDPDPSEFRLAEGTNPGTEKLTRKRPSGDHAAFIDHFAELYAEANGGAKPTWGDKQGALVKALLKAHGLAECRKRAENMFRAPPSWPPSPYSLATLSQHFDLFAVPHVALARASPERAGGGLTPRQILDMDLGDEGAGR